MALDPALAAGVLGVLAGAASAVARWIVAMTRGYSRLFAYYLLFIVIGGGGMGIAGGALARLCGCSRWTDAVSGALGAAAVIGFDAVIQQLLRKS